MLWKAAISRARSIASSHSCAYAELVEASEDADLGVSKVKCLSFCDVVLASTRGELQSWQKANRIKTPVS